MGFMKQKPFLDESVVVYYAMCVRNLRLSDVFTIVLLNCCLVFAIFYAFLFNHPLKYFMSYKHLAAFVHNYYIFFFRIPSDLRFFLNNITISPQTFDER